MNVENVHSSGHSPVGCYAAEFVYLFTYLSSNNIQVTCMLRYSSVVCFVIRLYFQYKMIASCVTRSVPSARPRPCEILWAGSRSDNKVQVNVCFPATSSFWRRSRSDRSRRSTTSEARIRGSGRRACRSAESTAPATPARNIRSVLMTPAQKNTTRSRRQAGQGCFRTHAQMDGQVENIMHPRTIRWAANAYKTCDS